MAVGVSSSCPLTICHVKTSPCQNVIRFFLPCRNSELREEIYFITEFCGCSRLLAPITLHISTLSHSLSHSMRNNFEERKDMSTLCKFYVGSEKRLVLDHVSTQEKLSSSHKKAK